MEEKIQQTHKNGIPHDLIIEPTPTQTEVAQAAPEQQPEQTSPEETSAPEQMPEPPKETYSQKNFKALKTEAARLARERDEAMALLRQYEMEKQTRQANVSHPAPVGDTQNYDFNLDNDALAEGKHVNTLSKELKAIKRELEAARVETKNMSIRASLIAEHPDYERVVTAENLKALELLKPHLARAINLNDPYNAGKTCYDLIKEFNIDAQEADKNEITKALIKENLSKPKVGVAVSGTKNTNTSPMGRASEFYEGPLTDEMKKIFYQELKDAMNGSRR